MTETASVMIDGIRKSSQDIGREARNMDSVAVGIASGWTGDHADAYSQKLRMLTAEIDGIRMEIDNLLQIMS